MIYYSRTQTLLLISLVEGLVPYNVSMGVSMETTSFTMTSFQSAHGQVAVRCEYSNSETDDRIAS